MTVTNRLSVGGSDGYIYNDTGNLFISATNGTVRFNTGLSSTNISATNYINLPSGSEIWNAAQIGSIAIGGTVQSPESYWVIYYDPDQLSWGTKGVKTLLELGANFGLKDLVDVRSSSVDPVSSVILDGDPLVWDSNTSSWGSRSLGNFAGNIAPELNSYFVSAGGGIYANSNYRVSSLSATTISATTYQNLPVSSLSGLTDVLISSTPTTNYVLKWNGTKWAPALDATGTGGGGLTDAYVTISDGVNSVNAAGGDTFSVESINSALSINLQSDGLGGFLPNIQFTVNQDQIGHNNLASLTAGNPHTQYATLSGATFTGQIKAPSFSATDYYNLPSGTALWNANKLQGVYVSTTTPTSNQALVYNGTASAWVPSSLPAPGGATAGTLILLNADETSVTGTTDNLTAKTYTVAANSYSKIIVESEITFRSQANVSCDVDFILSVTGVGKRTIKLEGDQTGTGDQFAMGAVLKWSEQLTGGGEVKIGADVIAGAGTWDVESLRVYGVI